MFLFCGLSILCAQEEASAPLKEELAREWSVVVLPFSAEDGEALRTTPLIQSLPNVITETLSFLRQRWLQDGERAGYIEGLVAAFPEEEVDPAMVPEQRRFSLRVEDIASSVQKQLYFSSLRDILRNDTPFPPALINRLKQETEADLFIGGNVQVQDQYVFLDLLLISPYVQVPTADGKKGMPFLAKKLFSVRSIEAQSELRQYIVLDFGADIYNNPAGSLEIGSPSTEEAVRVYLDGEYRGTAPLLATPLATGLHQVELFSGQDLLLSSEVTITENENMLLTPPSPNILRPQFALNSVPSGALVYEDSRFLGYTPLLVNRPEDTVYLQLSGDGLRESYVKITSEIPDYLSVVVPPKQIDLAAQLAVDRQQFYGSLGFAVVVGIIPLLLNGAAIDLATVNTQGFSPAKRQQFNNEFSAIRALTTSSLGVMIMSFIGAIGELFTYLATAEASRSVITP